MTWSHNDMWILTADHGGYVKYWQSNMNNVKMFQAHKEAIREARFIHNIPFSVVPIVMVKLFSKCILGAEMHGLSDSGKLSAPYKHNIFPHIHHFAGTFLKYCCPGISLCNMLEMYCLPHFALAFHLWLIMCIRYSFLLSTV